MSRLRSYLPFPIVFPRPTRPGRRPARALGRTPSCIGLVLLAGLTGCNTRVGRPDAEVARKVQREDRRLAQATALAAADLTPLGVVSDAAWIEAVALLVVKSPPPAPEPEPVGRADGWHYDAPATWGDQPWSLSPPDVEGSAASDLWRKPNRREEGALALEGGGDEGGKGKPKLRFNFLRLRIKDRPVSFSGSLKGLKSVQVKATIKL